MDSWQSDATSHRTRKRYKEGLIQKGRDEAMEEIATGKIQEEKKRRKEKKKNKKREE